jgi:hypothetical protein
VGTTITFDTGTVTVEITGDTPYSSCTYDKLDNWYGVDNVDLALEKRPSAPGAFAPRQTFPDAKVISVEGQFFGATRAAGLQMREDLAALYNEGLPVTMTVADDLRTTSREVLVESVTFPWTIHPEFEFTIDVTARDPRRYGVEASLATTLGESGEGMTWPISWPLDWGSIGATGRVVIANDGNAATMPRYVVAGGDMPDGFVIANLTTGERLTYLGPVNDYTAVTLDTATRAAFINGTAPGSRWLASPEWWSVPKRSSVEVAFVARGSTTGSPILTVYTRPAYY